MRNDGLPKEATGSPMRFRQQPNYEWAYGKLRFHLREVAKLLDKKLSSRPINEADHLAFIVHIIAVRQINHARSVAKLGKSHDTDLIARTMMEGMANALWVIRSDEKANRAERYRAFALVEDLRLAHEKLAEDASDKEALAMQRECLARLHGEGWHEVFLSDKARKKIAAGKRPPTDPYALNCRGLNVRDTFLEIARTSPRNERGAAEDAARLLYDIVYHQQCGWHHWSVGGLARVLERNHAGRFVYKTATAQSTIGALIPAFQSMLSVAEVADSILELGIGGALKAQELGFLAIARPLVSPRRSGD